MTRTVFASSRRDRKKAMRTRAWLNGVEVTNDCQIADDRAGRVLLLKRDESGHAYCDGWHQPVKEWRHGKVEIVTRRKA